MSTRLLPPPRFAPGGSLQHAGPGTILNSACAILSPDRCTHQHLGRSHHVPRHPKPAQSAAVWPEHTGDDCALLLTSCARPKGGLVFSSPNFAIAWGTVDLSDSSTVARASTDAIGTCPAAQWWAVQRLTGRACTIWEWSSTGASPKRGGEGPYYVASRRVSARERELSPTCWPWLDQAGRPRTGKGERSGAQREAVPADGCAKWSCDQPVFQHTIMSFSWPSRCVAPVRCGACDGNVRAGLINTAAH